MGFICRFKIKRAIILHDVTMKSKCPECKFHILSPCWLIKPILSSIEHTWIFTVMHLIGLVTFQISLRILMFKLAVLITCLNVSSHHMNLRAWHFNDGKDWLVLVDNRTLWEFLTLLFSPSCLKHLISVVVDLKNGYVSTTC